MKCFAEFNFITINFLFCVLANLFQLFKSDIFYWWTMSLFQNPEKVCETFFFVNWGIL